ncbi:MULTISPECIES: envelope stress response membrane protein PspC [Pseudoalteromonas]|uniref:envelope stress response membrane protein PspC n=1 Tax=Pseudoalteromonas TaxID=53246 RepID=UPI000FFF3C59|nr:MULTISPECIES: envelope stress response membrane protein PspC [Pseudoalteromonas]MCG9757742.1 envelope stress response membrane protein PspC [Pseudoalteromonas sp. Isolate6]NKC19246.1 envelope stress response membrane protein PspC [Pseudoalteromonas galatheae]RXE87177.1 envelope stress response membrane protein PspC [Pseudoalteromonas sp. A757]RZG16714.1 envelope stress response membrane protein PspC [Pseudoalteromonas sp. CO342X]
MSRLKRELYRDPSRGKVAGVCAGLSDYFNMELWLVRILFITAVLLSGGPLFIVVYVACWFILDKRETMPNRSPDAKDEDKVSVKFKVWQKGEPPRQALYDLKDRLSRLDGRIQNMERYVTSPEFTVSREIDKL